MTACVRLEAWHAARIFIKIELSPGYRLICFFCKRIGINPRTPLSVCATRKKFKTFGTGRQRASDYSDLNVLRPTF